MNFPSDCNFQTAHFTIYIVSIIMDAIFVKRRKPPTQTSNCVIRIRSIPDGLCTHLFRKPKPKEKKKKKTKCRKLYKCSPYIYILWAFVLLFVRHRSHEIISHIVPTHNERPRYPIWCVAYAFFIARHVSCFLCFVIQ